MTDPQNTKPFFPDADAPDGDGEYTETDFGGGSRPSTDDVEGEYTESDLGGTGREDAEHAEGTAGGDRRDHDGPGAPGNAEPMSESTEGGLRAGDPGVEE
ncbi:hypothetical protein [Agromyces aureus]|uniref:Uncharacterized protein n=1 Tax=Agromyces aureus TaxID=453304 RepID=A0A191WIS9_9MICO|nr:hypothetical protein [Agromyces aureus]ANJ28079.1 hypothetical protein ATC03_16545 [Agromyces aureus]